MIRTFGIQMAKLESSIKFHVIDADTSYQLLVGRIWMHTDRMMPSTYYQGANAIVKGKEVKIPETSRPFSINEVHFADAIFFEKFDKERLKSSTAQGVPLDELKKTILISMGHKRIK